MRTTVIISKRGDGYISQVSGRFGGGHSGARAGLTAYDAAATAARLMIEYAQSNPAGGDLMAPPEVIDLVPAHLRSIKSGDDAIVTASDVTAVAPRILFAGGDWRAAMDASDALTHALGDPSGVAADATAILSDCDGDAQHAIICTVKDRMEQFANWHESTGFNLTVRAQ